jgi:hypothetical protein
MEKSDEVLHPFVLAWIGGRGGIFDMKHGISCLLLMGMRICVQNAKCEIRNFQFYHMEFHVFFQRQLLRDLPPCLGNVDFFITSKFRLTSVNTSCWKEIAAILGYTRKNARVVTNLQQTCSNAVPTTSCQQDVFALLVPSLLTSCQRLVDNLLQGCWAQQTRYKLFQRIVIVLQLSTLSCGWPSCSNLIK